jgi:hypothetical protein
MTARDANADPLFDLFDFSKVSFPTPPSLPSATVNQQELSRCEMVYPSPSP